ncbi:MAG: RNA polymerase sigma factor [Gemmataceae bacterium]
MSARADGEQQHSTSATLLDRARDRDSVAWDRLVQLYSPLVHYWCQRWGCRPENRDDVVQEVMLAVSRSLGNFRKENPGDSFRGWLRGVARNTLLAQLRRDNKQPQGTGGSEALLRIHEVADSIDTAEEDPPEQLGGLHRRALELVRGEFQPNTWQMFWQTVVEGRNPVDIAADLCVSPAAVRMAKSRVLRRLKEEFDGLI